MKLVAFGVEQMNPGIGAMEATDLLYRGIWLLPEGKRTGIES